MTGSRLLGSLTQKRDGRKWGETDLKDRLAQAEMVPAKKWTNPIPRLAQCYGVDFRRSETRRCRHECLRHAGGVFRPCPGRATLAWQAKA
jgi:hypothetical protein